MAKGYCLGHLAADAKEFGNNVARITVIENNGKYKTTVPVVVFKKLYKIVPYLKKGTLVFIEGTIINNDYVDNKGVKQYTIDLRADSIKLLSKNSSPEKEEELYQQIGESSWTETEEQYLW
jgi:single-stranded DNA-binding protein